MNKTKNINNYKNIYTKVIVDFYINHDIISLDDVISLSKEEIMEKILEAVHPYSVFYSESDKRWHTTIKDTTKPSGRRSIAKKEKSDINNFLLNHYKNEIISHEEEAKEEKFPEKKSETENSDNVQLDTDAEETPILTFKEIFKLVQEEKIKDVLLEERRISIKNTLIRNDSEYRRFFSGTDFENYPINEITKKDIENICRLNLLKYKLKKKGFDSLRGILKSVFDHAYCELNLEDNIYNRVKFSKFKEMLMQDTSSSERVHSSEEVKQFLEILHQKQKKRPNCSSYWALELQMIMGLRRGEIPPLRWKEDITDTYVSITREQLTSETGFFIAEHTKTYKNRIFPITTDLREFLDRLKKMHDNYYPDSIYLFPADNQNGCITNQCVYRIYQRICRKLGIEIIKEKQKGPHSFRRNAITDVVNITNGNIFLACALFGNSPEVAKKNYYTGINVSITKEILEQRIL